MTQVGVLPDNDYDETNNPITVAPDNLAYNVYDEVSGGVENILTEERDRLELKEEKINKLYETHTRKKHFKNSIAKRNNAYWRMFMVLLLLAIIAVLLYMFRKHFPLVPSWVMDLVLIAVVAGGFIYMFTMYEDILKRDMTDFDKLDPYSPVMLRDKQIKKAEDLLKKGKYLHPSLQKRSQKIVKVSLVVRQEHISQAEYAQNHLLPALSGILHTENPTSSNISNKNIIYIRIY